MWFDAQGYIIKRDIALISKYHRIFEKGILLDTTLLLVLFLGKYDKDNNTKLLEYFDINEAGSTRKLTCKDFKILQQFINGLNRFGFFITPHIFTETVTHIRDKTTCQQFEVIMKYLLGEYSFLQEYHAPCKKICENVFFQRKKLEIGDVSLMIENDKKSKTIFSADTQLNLICFDNDFLVISFQDLTTLHYTLPNIS